MEQEGSIRVLPARVVVGPPRTEEEVAKLHGRDRERGKQAKGQGSSRKRRR